MEARADTTTVLVVGDSFVDVHAGPLGSLPTWGTNTVSPAPIEALPGGAALNVAASLQRLGIGTTLFSGIGRDAFGELLRSHCAKLGLRLWEAAGDDAAPTGVCMVLSGPEDRAFCSHFGVSDTFDASELTADALGAMRPALRHVHVSGFFSCGALRRSLGAFLRRARECGLTVSLDTNHDASGRWGAVDGLWDELLPLVDVFLPNEAEAVAISAASSLDEALSRLAQQVSARGAVVVTRGRDGAVCARRGEPRLSGASPVMTVVDTCGAGDSFKAGFLSRLVAGAPMADALAYGALTGALSVTRRGASVEPPTPQQVLAFAEAHQLHVRAAADALAASPPAASPPVTSPPVTSPPATSPPATSPPASPPPSPPLSPTPAPGNATATATATTATTITTTAPPTSNHDDDGAELLSADATAPPSAAEARRQRLVWWAFCLMWLGGTWPYQAILQAQQYYGATLRGLDFFVLMTFTWPLLGCHLLQVLSGAAKAAGFTRRIYAAFVMGGLVGAVFIAQDLLPMGEEARFVTICSLAALTAAAQVLLEPALFGLAASLPGGAAAAATQAMMVGNASAGVAVCAVAGAIRLAAGGGDPSPRQLRLNAQLFFGILILYSIGCCALFAALCRSKILAAAPAADPAASSAEPQQVHLHHDLHQPPQPPQPPQQHAASPPDEPPPLKERPSDLRERVRGLVAAARGGAARPACCQLLVFGCTLACWPSIPGAACAEGAFGRLGQGWWFWLVVAVYNSLDLVSRLWLRRLQRAARDVDARGARRVLSACGARLLIPPLVYICVRPRIVHGAAGNALILVCVAALALSNGSLATLSMMQLSRLPARQREDAVYVAVAALYLGLASGATVSWAVGRAMQLDELECV